MIQSFSTEQLQDETGLVYNPLNRDLSEYQVFLDNKGGLLNLSFNPREDQAVQNLIQSLINIDHETKTLTIDVTGILRVVTITQEILDSIIQDLGSDHGLVVGQTVILTGNSRIWIIRQFIAEMTADLGYTLVINPVRFEEVEFTPLSLLTEQTRDNSGVPLRFRQTAANVQTLIDCYEPRIEASNAKEKAGKLNAILGEKSGLSASTIFAIKKFLTLPDVLKDLANVDRITVDNAVSIAKITNSKDYKSIDMDVQSFLRLCLVHTGDVEKGVITEKHIKKAKSEIDGDNGFGKKDDAVVEGVDPTGELEPTEQEDKKTSPKALEGQRLRGLSVEDLDAENNEKMANAVDLIAEYQAELFDTDDKIKHNILISELIVLLQSSKTVAQKELEKAQQAETTQQEESQTIPVEFVQDADDALTGFHSIGFPSE